jgi:Reverse transcriptase (RNA-dependent DNA polymerase)
MESSFQDEQRTFLTHHDVFGMCNSPAIFQAMMDDIFMTMIDDRLVIVYMDDILIFANTKEELERITKLVLEKLRKHDLFLKAKKCEFCQTRIEYLGMIIEEGEISMDAVKLGGIRDWPVPTTITISSTLLYILHFIFPFQTLLT